jgi:WD40 repeat protein
MAASRCFRACAVLVAIGLGTAVLASDPGKEEALPRLRLAQLKLQQARQPKSQPKPPPRPARPMPAATPDGAIARLGDTRLRHAAPVTCVTFSADGRRIVTGGEDGALRIWDAETGMALGAVGINSTVAGVRFTRGGTRLAVGTGDGQVRFHHADTLKPESTIRPGDGGPFAVSADGSLIAAVSSSGMLTVTELDRNLPKLELPLESPTGSTFAFHPDGKTIAVGRRTGKVTLHLLAGGKPVASFDHGGPVNGMAFSTDGKRLATGGEAVAEVIKVWDLDAARGATNARPAAEIAGASRPRTWSGADRIAAAGKEGAGVYDLGRKQWVGFVKGISGEWAVSPDGKRLAATGKNALRVRLWDLASGKQLHAENDTFPDAALLVPTTDGTSLFVLAGDGGFVWPLAGREATPAGLLPEKAVAAAVGGRRLAVATSSAVLVYDEFDPAKGLVAKPSRRLTEMAADPRSVAVSPDGARVAYSGGAARVVIADAATGKTLRVLPVETIGLGLAFSPDSKTLAVLGRDAFLRLWPVDAGSADAKDTDLWRVRVQRSPRGSVAFSPDGKMVAATAATLLRVVDATTGEVHFDLDRRDLDDGVFQQVAFSPDSRLLVTGSIGLTGAVHAYEVATRSLVRRFSTGMGAVQRLAVFPDGTKAVSAGAEEVVTVWDLAGRHGRAAPTAEELAAAWGDLDSLDAGQAFRAGRTLIAGGASGLRAVAAGLDATAENRNKIAALLKDLASDEFADREAATKGLLAGGYPALLAVKDAAARSDSAEVRARASDIVNRLTVKGYTVPSHGLAGDNLRLVRAVPLIEEVGGPEAKPLLERIAKLAGPDDRARVDALAAIKRLKK